METTLIQKLVEGSPFIVGILLLAVVALWREVKHERNERISALTQSLNIKETAITEVVLFRKAIEDMTKVMSRE